MKSTYRCSFPILKCGVVPYAYEESSCRFLKAAWNLGLMAATTWWLSRTEAMSAFVGTIVNSIHQSDLVQLSVEIIPLTLDPFRQDDLIYLIIWWASNQRSRIIPYHQKLNTLGQFCNNRSCWKSSQVLKCKSRLEHGRTELFQGKYQEIR